MERRAERRGSTGRKRNENHWQIKKKDEPVGILELLGIALGCIRLSYHDFCSCYPDEFFSICKAWRDMRDAEVRTDWERTRLLAAITIQPHIKRKITPQKLLPLPWDITKPKPKQPGEKLTVEQHRQRAEEIERRINGTNK